MRKTFFLFLILWLLILEVSAIMQCNQQNIENPNFLVEEENQGRKYLDDDRYEEGSKKWDIDLSDMLHFDRLKDRVVIDGKPLTREEFSHLTQVERLDENYVPPEYQDTALYDEDEINALLEQDIEFKMQVQDYLLRYVNLFLNLMELKEKRMLGEIDEQIIDFDFVVSAKDLRALQDLSENFEERSLFDQLYVIDSIISKGIRVKPKHSFYDDFVNSISNSEFPKEFFVSKSSYFYILVGIAVTLIMARNLIGISYKFIAFIMINNMILMEGLFNYFRKIKEANIADYVDRMKYDTEYDACNPEGQSIFGKLYDLFYENQCLTYHKNMQINRADTIFPLESILNAYTFYFVEIPCKVIGTGINAFVVSVNAYLPMVIRQLGEVTTQLCIMGFLLLAFTLYLAGPQFSISLWGARFRLNFNRFIRGQEPGYQNPRQYRRIRGTTRAALNAIETDDNNEEDPADNSEEDSDSFTDEIAGMEGPQIEIEEIDNNSTGDEMEAFEEQAVTDDESMSSDEKNFSEDVETTEGSPSDN